MEFGADLADNERAVRVMAREDRFSRRLLGKAFWEFFELAKGNKVRSRMTKSPSEVVYVFLAMRHGTPREFRTAELVERSVNNVLLTRLPLRPVYTSTGTRPVPG